MKRKCFKFGNLILQGKFWQRPHCTFLGVTKLISLIPLHTKKERIPLRENDVSAAYEMEINAHLFHSFSRISVNPRGFSPTEFHFSATDLHVSLSFRRFLLRTSSIFSLMRICLLSEWIFLLLRCRLFAGRWLSLLTATVVEVTITPLLLLLNRISLDLKRGYIVITNLSIYLIGHS